MSLVLTAACPAFTVQVSDRLISTEDRRPNLAINRPAKRSPFDALSNKSIVYRARDAIVSMGYVGSAYLERKPTDEWIAERLWGEPLTVRTPDGRIPICVGPAPRSRDIGLAVRALEEALASVAPTEHGLTIAIAGWQAVRKNAGRPIVIELGKRPNDRSVSRFRSPRWLPKDRNLLVGEIGGYLTREQHESLGKKLVGASRSKDVLEAFESILAKTIRVVSATNSSVGPNLMSVIIPSARRGSPRVRFLPSLEHQIEVRSAGELRVLSASYSPWLIGPGILYPPSIIVGTHSVILGGIEVTIQADEPTGSIMGLSSTQKRPPAP